MLLYLLFPLKKLLFRSISEVFVTNLRILSCFFFLSFPSASIPLLNHTQFPIQNALPFFCLPFLPNHCCFRRLLFSMGSVGIGSSNEKSNFRKKIHIPLKTSMVTDDKMLFNVKFSKSLIEDVLHILQIGDIVSK